MVTEDGVSTQLKVDNLEVKRMIFKIPGLNVEEPLDGLGVTCLQLCKHRCC